MTRMWSLGAAAGTQRLRLLLQTAEVVTLRHLRYLTRFPRLINLDTEGLHLLSQTLLAGGYLSGHMLKDPGQSPQCTFMTGNVIEAGRVEVTSLDSRGGVREP